MIYDSYGSGGNCKGCGGVTEWHINGDYPLCRSCMKNLIIDSIDLMNNAGVIIIKKKCEEKL